MSSSSETSSESDPFYNRHNPVRNQVFFERREEDLSFNMQYDKQVKVCKNNMITNSVASLALLIISFLPYILVWHGEPSTMLSVDDESELRFSLFKVWVP